MRNASIALLALTGCMLLVAACGQKGPLYLPGRSSSFESMIPPQQPETEEQESEDDDEQTDNLN